MYVHTTLYKSRGVTQRKTTTRCGYSDIQIGRAELNPKYDTLIRKGQGVVTVTYEQIGRAELNP